jgi:PGF-pre-PGF domain-containing protein
MTVNVGGSSAASQTAVTGTGLNSLIVTGNVVSGPGRNTAPAPGTVYQYLDLVPARFTTINKEVISFSVPLAWLNGNGITPGKVVLYKLDGTSWTALPTTFVKTMASRDYFTAASPGFSRFAIAG